MNYDEGKMLEQSVKAMRGDGLKQRPMGPADDAMGSLNDQVNGLGKMLSVLEDRLGVVLAPRADDPAPPLAVPTEASSILVRSIREQAWIVGQHAARINDLLDRLEV